MGRIPLGYDSDNPSHIIRVISGGSDSVLHGLDEGRAHLGDDLGRAGVAELEDALDDGYLR